MELITTRSRWSLVLAVLALAWTGSDALSATPIENDVQKLLGADGASGDSFGFSVALDGDTLLIGAYEKDLETGAAYVFTRSGSTWTQQAKLTADDGVRFDNFGDSVALDGDTMVIGARGVNPNFDPESPGAAYVFTGSGSTWTQRAKLTAADDGQDEFGTSVALDGDTAVIGTGREGDPAIGAAYVFTGSGSTWTQRAKLTAADGASGDNFGFSVALDGDTAIIGAYGYEDGAGSATGAAYVFTGSGSTWTQQAKLTADDGAEGDTFGLSVALDGDTAVIGAMARENPLATGAAYVFTRSGSTWSEQLKLLSSDGASGDQFGYVDVLGAVAIVGARNQSTDNVRAGAAYIFDITVDDGGPVTAIEALLGELSALVSDGQLKNGQANGLSRPLENAIRSLEEGKTAAACSQLQDFINEVYAKTPTPLDAATSASLIAEAEALRSSIGC